MIRFATIGTNFVVEWFLKCAAQVEGLQYNGTYSRNIEKAEKFAKEHNGNLIFGNLEELAKSKDVDAVYIASPNSLHYEQARLMIKNKKHVMIEKTITSNLRELNELCRLAKENNVVIMEAMRSVYSPGFLAIKDAMKKIEPVRRVEFQYCQYSSRYDKYKNGIIENAFNPSFSMEH
ncbi:MAG: Gfo/Idh/MocA family protein [Eubacterium sp.]